MNDVITEKIAGIVQDVFGVTTEPEVTRTEPQFGDVATNVAMQLAKKVGQPPREIADQIATALRDNGDIKEVSIAGPGFINIRVQDKFLIRLLDTSAESTYTTPSKAVIETNNPNPFKDLHIGHAYNCIIADTQANLLEAGGAEVHRVSYHGDIGLHVGKSMWAILRFLEGDVTKLKTIVVSDRPTFMSRMYVEGAHAYEEDETVKATIDQLAAQSFVLDDPLFAAAYKTCKGWSFDYIDATIKRLGSQPTERRYLESEADDVGVATVKKHIGNIFQESDGAVIFPGEAYGLHTRVFVSSRGTGLYEARDLGLMQLKQADFHPDKSYIVTAEEQRDYFNVVIKAAEQVLPELDGVTTNISTGTVKLSTGKMSSRTGEVLSIEWLFDQLHAAARVHNDEINEHIIIGALRYAFLKVRVGSDVIFNVEESLSIEGNSGPYLQYAHARARSILAKKDDIKRAVITDEILDEYERSLALSLGEYREIVQRAARDLLPHLICTYLYELAQCFNRFYEKSRVLGDEREVLRLQLVLRYADTLRDGLEVLGITAPNRL